VTRASEQQRVAQRQQHEADREGIGQIGQGGRRREEHRRCRPEQEHHGHGDDASSAQRAKDTATDAVPARLFAAMAAAALTLQIAGS
jgi:hypothetical protein